MVVEYYSLAAMIRTKTKPKKICTGKFRIVKPACLLDEIEDDKRLIQIGLPNDAFNVEEGFEEGLATNQCSSSSIQPVRTIKKKEKCSLLNSKPEVKLFQPDTRIVKVAEKKNYNVVPLKKNIHVIRTNDYDSKENPADTSSQIIDEFSSLTEKELETAIFLASCRKIRIGRKSNGDNDTAPTQETVTRPTSTLSSTVTQSQAVDSILHKERKQHRPAPKLDMSLKRSHNAIADNILAQAKPKTYFDSLVQEELLESSKNTFNYNTTKICTKSDNKTSIFNPKNKESRLKSKISLKRKVVCETDQGKIKMRIGKGVLIGESKLTRNDDEVDDKSPNEQIWGSLM